MRVPVLFIIFKRVDTTKKVFECIRKARPSKLYVAADGPRPDRPDELTKCLETRRIIESIDWDCEVKTLFRDTNLGCGKGVSSAITWFFENEEEGIILEDDIVPHPDFFQYCDEMLERYRNDERIQLIAGRNELYENYKAEYSYYMSSLVSIWGWATWRRVWNSYELDVKKLSKETYINKLKRRNFPFKIYNYWKHIFSIMEKDKCDTWDYQLFFNQILYDRYSIVPYINMTENIGFNSEDAAHTVGENLRASSYKSYSPYPLIHPDTFHTDMKADMVFSKNANFGLPRIYVRIINKLKKMGEEIIFHG